MNVFRIVGAIALVWGAFVVISFFLRQEPTASGAYGAGQYTGVVIGAFLFLAGLFAVVRGGRKPS